MNKIKRISHVLSTGLLVAGVSLTAVSQPAIAATRLADTAEITSANGIEFKLSESGGVYTVSMRPNATPGNPNATISAQVTVKLPHGSVAPSNITSLVSGTNWDLSSRNDAPAEAPGSDYVSFSLDFPSGDYKAFQWSPGSEVAVFTFTTGSGGHLMDSCDAFAVPNSLSASVGNEIAVLGFGDGSKSAYVGNYAQTQDCPAQIDAVSAVALEAHTSASSTVQAGDLIVYTFNISNTGLRTAENLLLHVSQTGLADMQAASNSFAAANPVLLANQSATWHLGQLAPGAQGSVVVTMIAPKSNATLTTQVSIEATNDNSANDNDAQVVVVVLAAAPTQTENHQIYVPLLMR